MIPVISATPRCIHFGSCGGCTSQNIAYESQLALKEQNVRDIFGEQGDFYPIMPSNSVWNYRNKMEYSFSETSKGEKFLGLIIAKTRGHVFNLEECHLVDPWLVDVLTAVRAWWLSTTLKAYWHGKNAGSLRTLTVRHGMTTGDRMVILTVSGNPEYAIKQHDLDTFVAAVKEAAVCEHLSIVLRIQQIAKGVPTQFYEMILFGPDYIREKIAGLEFHVSPKAFFQPNTFTAEKLYERALQLAGITEKSIVYDLYCGIGIFGMCAAKKAKEVIGIELSPDSAYDAKTNSQRLGIKNFTIYEGDVAKVLAEKKELLPHPDVVIVDPPRPGLDGKALALVASLQARTIVYVSCNPLTQVDNCKALAEHGYKICYIQPVDQFPHTPHIENIVILTL
ncbi:MAG: rumA1 [Chlamydiia bacterium]|nr:rumA1 [Chlamydiia bacterium]